MKTTTLLFLSTTFSLVAQVPVPNVAPKTNVNYLLGWDASTTPSVTYVVRRGIVSGKYDEMATVNGLTYTWSNAPSKMTNYFVVTAKNSSGVESDYSNELKIEPLVRPETPNLKTAVPVTVKLQRKESNGEWVDVYKVGPLYSLTDSSGEFRSAMTIGKPVKILPE